jgi:U-box domain
VLPCACCLQATDPFTRAPLEMSQLIDNAELAEQIAAWRLSNGGGG